MTGGYGQGLINQIGINALLGLSVYVILATGQLSLGNAAFMAMGAYGSALLSVKAGVPLVVALLVAAAATGVIGAAIGFPALRFRGIYLAMATLALGEIVRTFFLNFEPTGGAQGFYGMKGVSTTFIWAFVLGVLALLLLLQRSGLWLGLRAVNDDEDAAEMTGVHTTAVKVGAFAFGALIAALAGGLFAQYSLFVEPGNFDSLASIEMVLFVILGGSRTAWGPLVGAVVLTLLPEVLRPIADWRMAVYGGLLVLVLIVRPQGIAAPGALRAALAWLRSPVLPWRQALEGRTGEAPR